MKVKIYLQITFRIALLFIIPMFATFLTDLLRGFFGDVQYDTCTNASIDPCWSWSARHYWYFWMNVCLWIVAAISVIGSIVTLLKKHKS